MNFFTAYIIQLLLTALIISFYFASQRYFIPRLEIYIQKGALKNSALKKAVYVFRLVYGVVSLALILLVWGFDFHWLAAFSSGIIALTGVALFASWSVLSNITAYFILLVHEAYKRGSFIRIIEADNYVEGYISEINIFNTTLLTESREYIVYPNNLLIARPTVFSPKKRYNTVGKIQEFAIDDSAVKQEQEIKT